MTECFTALIPLGKKEDIFITLWVGYREGVQILHNFMIQRTWSVLLSHLSL